VAGTTPAFLDRLSELLALDKVPTWLLRQEVLINAVHGWQQRPWLGWGLNSYRYVYPPAPQAGFWIPNLELHILFDTGLVGLLLVAGAVGGAVRGGVRALRGPVAGWSTAQYALFGLLFAGLGLFLAYQLTEGTGLGFTWLFFAMLVAAGRYATPAPPAGPPHLRQPPAAAGAPQGPPSTV
jgi:O-antigen ligase